MRKALFPILLLFGSTALAAAPNVAGKWTIHTSIAGIETDQKCTIMASDKMISGSCTADDKTSPLKGSIDGDKVTFYTESDSNGTSIKLTYKVTDSKADQFSGTVDVAPYGISGDFAATPLKQ